MNYAVAKVEFSPDPLSDTTPSWIDVSRYCRTASWSSGKAKDLDDPQAGAATFLFKNDARRFEPEYVAGAYYPNIRPLRRFRLSIITAAGTVQQGLYYATSWTVTYPAGTDYSTVEVACVDGFGVLSLNHLATLDPSSAANLADVIASDNPYAHFRLGERTGTKMVAAVGQDGTYHGMNSQGGVVQSFQPPLVVGEVSTSMSFSSAYGLSLLDSANNFADGNAFTVEAVIHPLAPSLNNGFGATIAAGPWSTSGAVNTFEVQWIDDESLFAVVTYPGGGLVLQSAPGTIPNNATHHIAVVWNGHKFWMVLDGFEFLSLTQGGVVMRTGDAGGFLGVGGGTNVPLDTVPIILADVAFYEYALTDARIKAHADAALNRGYNAQTVGDRIAALAANALWSTAGITASQLTAEARMHVGQSTLDEINATAAAERPYGLFYFDASGNPQYEGWNDNAVVSPVATFGDGPGEIHYTAISVIYDDELYNEVTTSRDGGDAQLVDDATSQAEFAVRNYDSSNLILSNDTDAGRVAQTIVDQFSQPQRRVDAITLNGAIPGALTHILNREIGDTIRVRRLSSGGAPIDMITTILGKAKSITPDGNLVCTWNLARGFNASIQTWRLGVSGYSELGQTAVLG